MEALDPDELLGDTETLLKKLLKTVESTRLVSRRMKKELDSTRKENERLKKRIHAVKSENRALHIARKRLIEERISDKEKIRRWQAHINEASSDLEKSTQEPIASTLAIPSSPPPIGADKKSHEIEISTKNEYSDPVSQPILPMSIGVNEMSDGHLETQHIQYSPFESSPSIQSGSSEIESDGELHTQSQQQQQQSQQQGEPESESPIYTQRAMAESINSEAVEPPISNETDAHSNELKWLKSLTNREWHPADFKPNPHYNPNSTFKPGLQRNKEHRKCLRGTSCQDCSLFYQITGIINAIQSGSRHRLPIDKQPTPVGFWTMDFPESGHSQEEKDIAQQQWLNEGRERLEEALIGGRYLFKDDAVNKRLEEFRRVRH